MVSLCLFAKCSISLTPSLLDECWPLFWTKKSSDLGIITLIRLSEFTSAIWKNNNPNAMTQGMKISMDVISVNVVIVIVLALLRTIPVENTQCTD